jgi:hypothetical protein
MPKPEAPISPRAFVPPPVTPPTPPAAPTEPKDWGPLKPIRPVPKPSGAKMDYVLSSTDNPTLAPETSGKRKGMLILAIVILVVIIGGGTAAFIFFGKKSDEVAVNNSNANTNSTIALSNSNVNKNANTNSNQNVNSAGNLNISNSNTNTSNVNVAGNVNSIANVNAVGNTNQATNSSTNINGALPDMDPDKDGLPTDLEVSFGTDPQRKDTDGDGFSDGDELQNGYNPLGTGRVSVSFFNSYCKNKMESFTGDWTPTNPIDLCTEMDSYIQSGIEVVIAKKPLTSIEASMQTHADEWCNSHVKSTSSGNANETITRTDVCTIAAGSMFEIFFNPSLY